MCGSTSVPAPPPPPPPPAAPPVLEQIAPKSASSDGESKIKKKSKGLSRYKMGSTSNKQKSTGLGGIPKKSGAGV